MQSPHSTIRLNYVPHSALQLGWKQLNALMHAGWALPLLAYIATFAERGHVLLNVVRVILDADGDEKLPLVEG